MLEPLSWRIHKVLCLDVPELELLKELLALTHVPELGQLLLAIAEVVDDVLEDLAVSIEEDFAVLLDHRLELVI